MKNGLDRKSSGTPDDRSNVVSLKDARARAEKARDEAAKVKAGAGRRDDGGSRISIGQWVVGVLFMLMAIGGAFALVRPLVKGAGIAGGWGIG